MSYLHKLQRAYVQPERRCAARLPLLAPGNERAHLMAVFVAHALAVIWRAGFVLVLLVMAQRELCARGWFGGAFSLHRGAVRFGVARLLATRARALDPLMVIVHGGLRSGLRAGLRAGFCYADTAGEMLLVHDGVVTLLDARVYVVFDVCDGQRAAFASDADEQGFLVRMLLHKSCFRNVRMTGSLPSLSSGRSTGDVCERVLRMYSLHHGDLVHTVMSGDRLLAVASSRRAAARFVIDAEDVYALLCVTLFFWLLSQFAHLL